MKTLIIYCSKYGTTEKVVRLIAEKSDRDSITTVNLNTSAPISLLSFERILIGGSIYEGSIQKQIRKFCKENIVTLLQKELGLFICCMNREKEKEQFERAFPEELRKHAKVTGYFGGELLYEKMNFLDKMIARIVSPYKNSISLIDYAAIDNFVKQLNKIPDYNQSTIH